MAPISHRIQRNGVLGLPKTSPATKTLTEDLLLKDAQAYHCYFNDRGFHNHLSHHLLTAYDFGASPGLIQKIYDMEARIQRPIILEETDKNIQITDENWVQYIGNPHAYNGFFTFFQHKVATAGAVKTLEEFIFSPAANEKGKIMLVRLMGGALHPFILLGYGLEFGNDLLITTGIAEAAVHLPNAPELFEKEETSVDGSNGLTVLEILELVYKSSVLKPVRPSNRMVLFGDNSQSMLQENPGIAEDIRALCAKFHVDESLGDAEMMSKIEEIIWASVLILFATGKEGKKPRLDFFLMHLVTSSLFLRCYIDVLKNPAHKVAIIKAFFPGLLLYTIARGRPIINPLLLMAASDKPRPPYVSSSPYKVATSGGVGGPLDDENYNPWPALIDACQYASDVHVTKTLRTLVLASKEYGDTPAGGVIGAFKRDNPKVETHPGIAKVDGTVFARAAGILMDYTGWKVYGQAEREDWDRTGLGWEEAWNDEA
ncbi:hypothetical protein BDP27DRAFT_1231849 [Rhodocollybia butyracea]|uniref:Oxidoreductase AflY n=1 Tax=Rhodocollybia butyracea TaxID=206335 RepID=A0A9P5U1F6_9AGAR|nr:hypothetical protein BDP27DRAFT_1231849 [Rhodocollybia butyracea]